MRRWKAFLLRLEKMHKLDAANEQQRWLLHFLFLDMLNEDLQKFRTEWNLHGISSSRMENKSPIVSTLMFRNGAKLTFEQAMRLLSMAQYGVRPAPTQNTLVEILELYYGEAIDEELQLSLEDLDSLVLQMDLDQSKSIRHPGVRCDAPTLPFRSQAALDMFAEILEDLIASDTIPDGYGLLPAELGDEGYPDHYTVQIGRRGGKTDTQELPVEVWYPRAVAWARGLEAMERAVAYYED